MKRCGFGCRLGDQQPSLPGAAGEFPGDRKQPVAPPFQVPDPGGMACRQDGQLHPGHEVHREHGQVRPELVGGKPLKGSLPSPVFFRVLMRFSHLARARCRASRNATFQRGALVRNAVTRCPSTSKSEAFAPGCNGSARK